MSEEAVQGSWQRRLMLTLLLALSTTIVALGLRLSGQRFVDVMRRS
jgi:hypothetical protein